MPRSNEHEFLMHVLKGHAEAVEFVEKVAMVSQVWDDLVDQDREVTKDQINAAFRAALYEIPMNGFYQRFSYKLTPLMDVFIQDWLDANALEGTDETGTQIAYVLRDSVGALAIHCAGIVGGYEWMREVAPEIRRFIFDQSYADYRREHVT